MLLQQHRRCPESETLLCVVAAACWPWPGPSHLQDAIYCRRQGTYPLTEVVAKGGEVQLSPDHVVPLEWVQLRLPGLAVGAYQVEAQRGLLCSAPQSFLVVEDPEAAAELRRLEASPMGEPAGPACTPPLLLAVLCACCGRGSAATPMCMACCHRGSALGQHVALLPPGRWFPPAAGHPLLTSSPCLPAACSPVAGIADTPEFLHKVGIVLQFQRQRCGAAPGQEAVPPAAVRRIARCAQEVAAACILRGWPALLRAVLPVATADCPPAEAVAGIQAHLGSALLLHAAVVAGVPAVVEVLGAWAQAAGYSWQLDVATAHGLTPLHFAAMLTDPASMALALTRLSLAGPKLWQVATTQSGVTPLDLAYQLRRRSLLEALAGMDVGLARSLLSLLDAGDCAGESTGEESEEEPSSQAGSAWHAAEGKEAGKGACTQHEALTAAFSSCNLKRRCALNSTSTATTGSQSPASVLEPFPDNPALDADLQLLCKSRSNAALQPGVSQPEDAPGEGLAQVPSQAGKQGDTSCHRAKAIFKVGAPPVPSACAVGMHMWAWCST